MLYVLAAGLAALALALSRLVGAIPEGRARPVLRGLPPPHTSAGRAGYSAARPWVAVMAGLCAAGAIAVAGFAVAGEEAAALGAFLLTVGGVALLGAAIAVVGRRAINRRG